MKILFITDNFPPEINAAVTRTYEHVKKWMKDKDVEVSVYKKSQAGCKVLANKILEAIKSVGVK